jgi:hypothetical protein
MEVSAALEVSLPTVVESEMAVLPTLLTLTSMVIKPVTKEVVELVLSLVWAMVVLEVVSSG